MSLTVIMPICAALLCTASGSDHLGSAAIQQPPQDRGQVGVHGHTHTSGEIDTENEPDLLLEASYTFDLAAVASGGLEQDVRYLDNLDVIAFADLEGLIGWQGATAEVYLLYNNGTSLSEIAGDAQATSNIETGVRAVRLYTAWFEQELAEGASIKLGLYDVNSAFDALDSSGLFTQSAHGIGTDIAQTGRNGPSIFPATSLAARLAFSLGNDWHLRAAVADGVPGNPVRPAHTSVRLGNGDGAFIIGEVEAPLPDGKLLFGHWRYTGREELLVGGTANGNKGFYFRGETQLTQEQYDPAQGLSGFFRYGIARDRFNPFGSFLGAGLSYTGPFSGRDDDRVGVAVATAFASDDQQVLDPALSHEIAIELSYRAEINEWLALQPHAHWVINPSADPRVDNALVLGLRLQIGFQLER